MPDQLVHLKGGMVARESDLRRLLDIEGRGVHFSLADDGKVRVNPAARLTDSDRVFLLEHHALVVYCLTVTYSDDGAVRT